jgi:hypothetical protein
VCEGGRPDEGCCEEPRAAERALSDCSSLSAERPSRSEDDEDGGAEEEAGVRVAAVEAKAST